MSTADIVAIAVGVGGLIATVLLGIQSNRLASQQNEIFREQNRIFAAQAGIKMPETLSRKTLGFYWPTIAAGIVAIVVGITVSYLQKSLIFAGASSLVMLLAFGAALWGSRTRKITPQVPVPITISSKPLHNVQCLGVRAGEKAADIGFVNMEIPNRTVASFHRARLKIRYSLAHSGQAVEIVFPARWIDSDEYDISIGFVPVYAVLAVQIGSEWYGVETEEVLMPHAEIEAYYRRKLKPLPSGKLRIEATLIGENNLSLAPFTGTLTLGENGMASFDSE